MLKTKPKVVSPVLRERTAINNRSMRAPLVFGKKTISPLSSPGDSMEVLGLGNLSDASRTTRSSAEGLRCCYDGGRQAGGGERVCDQQGGGDLRETLGSAQACSLSPLSAFPLATTRLSCILRPLVAHHYNAESICKPMVYVM